MSNLPRVLVICERRQPSPLIRSLVGRGTFRVTQSDLRQAADSNGLLQSVDAVVIDGSDMDTDRQLVLRELLDLLDVHHVGALILAPDIRICNELRWLDSREMVWVSASDSLDEAWGRLVTIIAHRPAIRRLQAEILALRRVQGPLSSHFNQIDEEMRLAGRLQRDFLPRELPQLPNVRFAYIYRPATWVSGDMFDIFRLDEQHVGFYVADAVGHGMPAALLTMFIKRALVTKRIRGSSYELVPPAESLRLLNNDLLQQNLTNSQFATACYCVLNTNTLQLQLARAGHPPTGRRAGRWRATLQDGERRLHPVRLMCAGLQRDRRRGSLAAGNQLIP